MSDSKKVGKKLQRGKVGLSRRNFVAASAAGAALPFISGQSLWAADSENVIRVGFVSPRTGNLGTFGVGDGYLADQVRKALDKGLKVGDKTYKVVLLDRDSQSDPARAGQLAKALISSDKIDFMLVTSTPEVVNPVADACEAAGVPCLSTVMPWEAWYFGRGGKPGQPSPFKWTYHFAFGGAQFAGLYLSLWKQIPNNKKVGVPTLLKMMSRRPKLATATPMVASTSASRDTSHWSAIAVPPASSIRRTVSFARSKSTSATTDASTLFGEAQRRCPADPRTGPHDHRGLAFQQLAAHLFSSLSSSNTRRSALVGHACTTLRIASIGSPAGSITMAFVRSS